MRWRRTVHVFLLVSALACRLAAQVEVAGRLVDAVVCEDDESQSYALYVPSNYSREQKWPVIFCFDARARGRIPVERLQSAAERYGYVVAGSLNSRNGPWTANAAAIQAMVKDVSAHLSIDQNRVYTCGVSGGARVATTIALNGSAKGVIACSGGFPQPGEIPQKIDFYYFSTAGVDDCNFQELARLDSDLASRSAPHRLVQFDGGHEWPPAAVFMEAVEWLELQSMRNGGKARDAAFIHAQFEQRTNALVTLRGAARWRELRSIQDDFRDLAPTAEFEIERAGLDHSPELKAELNQEEEIARREEDLFLQLEEAARGPEHRKRELADELRTKAAANQDSPGRRLVRRVLGGFALLARERVQSAFAREDYAAAIGYLELAAALDPKNHNALELARAKSLESARAHTGAAASDEELVQLPELRVAAVLSSVELRLYHLPNVKTDISSRGTAPLSFLGVETVRAGSKAAHAGITVGLQVTAIQGLRIRGLTEERLYESMDQPARGEIVVTVRDTERGKEREVHIPVGRSRKEPARDRLSPAAENRDGLSRRTSPGREDPDAADNGF